MSVIIIASLVDSEKNPIAQATLGFYADVTVVATFTTTTDGSGRANITVDPGHYTVIATVNATSTILGPYTVKAAIPSNFSGIEMITGTPGSSDQFQPQRFRNTRYESSNMALTKNLVQYANWRI